jgi:hypothetical protein
MSNSDNKAFIIEQFRAVKALGFVKSNRGSDTGIGKTFEDYVGVVENNLEEPDLAGYEIKSHREVSNSYITLFTKVPEFPPKANAYLLDRFGTPYPHNPNLKELHTSMFATRLNTYKFAYSFKLINDRVARQIRIEVYDMNSQQLIDSSVGYSYAQIEDKLHGKLKDLFYVSAERKTEDDGELFYFNKAEIYSNPSLDKFLDLIDGGVIMFDIRIGSYKSGKNLGKAHDHGSGFRIKEEDMKLLFENQETVE